MKKKTAILFLLTALEAVVLTLLFKTTFLDHSDHISQKVFYFIKVLIVCANLTIVSNLYYLCVVKNDRKALWHKNCSSILFSLVVSFILLEGVFIFVARSHHVGYTLASQRWFEYFWRPINADGYRDQERVLDDRKNIVVLGDSMTAGHGIKSVRKRFSDLLEVQSNGQAQVWNFGVNGNDTRKAMRRFSRMRFKPDVLVLQYFGNDIEGAAAASDQLFGFTGNQPYQDLNHTLQWFVQRSYLLNFLYWLSPHQDYVSYDRSILAAHLNSAVMYVHHQDLQALIKYCQNNSIEMVFVLFPYLNNLSASRPYMQLMERFFSSHNVGVVNVENLIADLTLKERIVNVNDAHPSEKVHQRVADALYAVLNQ